MRRRRTSTDMREASVNANSDANATRTRSRKSRGDTTLTGEGEALRHRPGESKTREQLEEERAAQRTYIHLLLALQGYSWPESSEVDPREAEATRLMRGLFQKARRIKQLRCPVDAQISLAHVASSQSLVRSEGIAQSWARVRLACLDRLPCRVQSSAHQKAA